MKKEIASDKIKTAGPYSQGMEVDGLIFLSGQIPLDSQSGQLIQGDIQEKAQKCFDNIKEVLSSADLTLDNIIKVTVFLTDISDFAAVNEIYAKQFKKPYPARSAIGVAALPLGAEIEIEVIAKR